MSLSRRDLLRGGVGLAAGVAVARLQWVERALAAAPSPTQKTLSALAAYVVPDAKLRAPAVRRLTRTLDRFLPGPQPLSATAASILDGAAAQVRSGATFAKLTQAEKTRAFQTLESLPVESAGSIRFLVGNLQDLTAFLAYATARRRLLGTKEFKRYWRA